MISDINHYLRNIVPRGLSTPHRRNGSDSTLTDRPPNYNDLEPIPQQPQKQHSFQEKVSAYWNHAFKRGYSYQPYIGLGARLSQIWINQWTVVMILVLIKIFRYKDSLAYALKSAEKHSMSACEHAEDMVSNAISMPHYMAQGANELIKMGVDHAISALIKTLLLIITGVENLIIFSIEMIIGTYACLITAAINSSAGTAINATESLINYVNDGLEDITDELEDGLNGLSKVINGAGNVIESVGDFFTGKDDTNIKDVNLTIDKLHDFKIPASVNEKLTDLRDHLPTYNGVKNETENLIRTPFNKLKTELNGTLHDKIQFNAQALAVPEMETANFCSDEDGIHRFFDELNKAVTLTAKIIIIALIIAAILVCVPVIYREVRDWLWMKECARRDQSTSSEFTERMAMLHDANNRGIVTVQKFAAKAVKEGEERVLVKWWIDYIFYPPALATLLLALCGFLVVILQYIMLYQISQSLPAFQQSIGRVTGEAVGIIRTEGINWSKSTNHELNSTESHINDDVFGWVHTATTSVNDTLKKFQGSMNKTLHDDFDGTPLYDPIAKVMYCVVGSKIENVEQGLTWVHENAKVTLPRVNDSYLLDQKNGLNPDKVANSIATTIIDTLESLIDAYEKSLHLELYISTVLLGVWLLVALLGLAYCFYVRKRNSPLATGGLKPSEPPAPPLPSSAGWSSMNHEIRQGIAFPGFTGLKPPTLPQRDTTPLSEWPQGDALKPPSIISTVPSSPGEKKVRPETEIYFKGVRAQHAVVVEPMQLRKSTRGYTDY